MCAVSVSANTRGGIGRLIAAFGEADTDVTVCAAGGGHRGRGLTPAPLGTGGGSRVTPLTVGAVLPDVP